MAILFGEIALPLCHNKILDAEMANGSCNRVQPLLLPIPLTSKMLIAVIGKVIPDKIQPLVLLAPVVFLSGAISVLLMCRKFC